MILLPYDPKVEVLWFTPEACHIVTEAASTTQKGVFLQEVKSKERLIPFLYDAGHTTPLEHAVICFRISQISRACADQLRTHRIASHTMSSTHYQNHAEVPHRVPLPFLQGNSLVRTTLNQYERMMALYTAMIDQKIPKEDARQLLPLSIEVRYMLTINASSLAHLLRLRMCFRNTDEMVMLAYRLRTAAIDWFPELFNFVGTACMEGQCNEGHMRCDYATRQEQVGWYAK